jgi:hypothetical protein
MGLTLFIFGMYACIKLNRGGISELRVDHLMYIKTAEQGLIYIIIAAIIIASCAHFYNKAKSNVMLFKENRNLRVSLEKISFKSLSSAELALKEVSLSLDEAIKIGVPIIELEQQKEKLKNLEVGLLEAKDALDKGEVVIASEKLIEIEVNASQISEQIKKAIEKSKIPSEKTKK